MTVGERIFKLRKDLNISQGDLARMMQVSRQAVSKWENDLAAPDTLRLIQLADVLNTEVEYLATGNKTPIKTKTEVIIQEKPVEVLVEKVVEKPIFVEKTVKIPQVVETIVERPVLKKVIRIKYLRNPLEFAVVGLICFLAGVLIGHLF